MEKEIKITLVSKEQITEQIDCIRITCENITAWGHTLTEAIKSFDMKLDNIRDIEILRKLEKSKRVKVKEDINAYNGNYTFKKDSWCIVETEGYYINMYSEDYTYRATITFKEASRYLYA